jgi:hypothetical protein
MSNIKYTKREAHLALRAIISMSKAANNQEDEIMNELVRGLGPDIECVMDNFKYLFNVLIEFIPEEERHYYEKDYERSKS